LLPIESTEKKSNIVFSPVQSLMKILFIVPYVPNLIRVRPYNLLKVLADRGHEITLFTIWNNSSELKDLEDLNSFLKEVHAFQLNRWQSFGNCLKVLPTREPLQASYCWQPDLIKKILHLISSRSEEEGFDIIHVEHLRGIRYALELKRSKATQNLPLVWDSVDSITRLFGQTRTHSTKPLSRLMANFEYGRTRQLEATVPSNFDRTLVTSQADMRTYLELGDHHYDTTKAFSVLPNGVDLQYFHVNESVSRQPATLVISGKMSYHANVSMVNFMVMEILPIIWDKRPDVQLWIVGKDPPKDIQKLGDSSLIHVTGTVPDVRPFLQSATIAVAPLVYGTGVQNKVLESMACGTPVVATSLAVSALSVRPGRDLLVGDHPQGFAHQILTLLENPQDQKSFGLAGRRYVEENHRWETIAMRLEGIYREVNNEKH
jgi:glycosyltransferase involved in cell wall biosynthesis